MTVFLILLSFVVIFSEQKGDNCCILNVDEGKIDLTPLKDQFFSAEIQTYPGHMTTTTLCDNLDKAHECVYPTETEGPTPFKDEYGSTDGSCWYIGGLDGCTIGDWDNTTKTFVITYPGKPGKTGQVRSVEYTLHCDPMQMETLYVVSDVRSEGNTHTYIADVTTYLACPGGTSEMNCEVCMAYMNSIYYELTESRSIETHEDNLKKYFCPGEKERDVCDNSVDFVVPRMGDLLSDQLPARTACQAIGLC